MPTKLGVSAVQDQSRVATHKLNLKFHLFVLIIAFYGQASSRTS
jgi:hypothetical protein